MDLIRQLMIDISDENLDWDSLNPKEMYHLEMLVQKNYLTGVEVFPEYYRKLGPIRLTFDGHEFAETIRPKQTWQKIKTHLSEKGVGLTVDTIVKAAPSVIAALIK
ncbi:MAG: DUF2513 domain-containing protein [Sphingorhabdus sp.]